MFASTKKKKSMKINDFPNQIRNYVGNDELDEALKMLIELTVNSRKHDEAILLSSRLREISRGERLGTNHYQEISVERNRIRLSILDLVRLMEADNRIITRFEINEKDKRKIAPKISLNGRWLDKADDDVVFFQQREDKVVGIYDYGRREKVGYYLGQINGDVLEYKWEWFNRDLIGYGQMIITKNKLSGSWWYNNYEDELEHVEYEYLDDKMPKWLDYMDFKEIWYKKLRE